MMKNKLRAGLAVLSLSALALTACGNDGNAPASNNGEAGQQQNNNAQGQAKPFSEISADVKQQLQNLKSYKLQGEFTASDGKVQISSVQTVDPQVAADMKIKMDMSQGGQQIKGGFDMKLVGDNMYMKFGDDLLDNIFASAGGEVPRQIRETFDKMRGKYMTMPFSETGQSAPNASDFTKFAESLDISKVEDQGEPAEINGQSAFKYKGTGEDGETLFFIDAADGKTLLAVEGSGEDIMSENQLNTGNTGSGAPMPKDLKGRARISDFNQEFKIEAPSKDETVDMSEIMPGGAGGPGASGSGSDS